VLLVNIVIISEHVYSPAAYQGGYKRIYTSKIAKTGVITTNAEYVANLVNVNMWM